MYNSAIRLKIPPSYIYNDMCIFDLAKELGLQFIISRYGQSEGIMVWYHSTGNYNDVVNYWYSTQNDFLRKYTAWKVSLKTKMKNTLSEYLAIQSNYNNLKRFIKQPCTEPEIQREYIRYTLKLRKPLFDTTKLIEIFDNIAVNEHTTIIMMIENYERKYKIFDSPNSYKIDYTKITNRNDDDGIWIYNLTGTDPININSYTISNILPSNDDMYINCESYFDWKSFLDDTIYTEVSKSTVRINFSFNIMPDKKIKWPLWYYGLATSDFASTWLYITETTNVYTQIPNDVPAINFKDYYNVVTTSLGTFRMKEGETGISIKANKVVNRKIMNEIYDIVPRLLTWYIFNENSLMEEIKEILPSYTFETEDIDYIANTKYRALKNALPYLFENDDGNDTQNAETVTFGTACQGKNQPVFIEESEIEEFKLLGPNHTVGIYPPHDEVNNLVHEVQKQYFICPTVYAPYASLTSNLDPKTSKKFPLIPCCSRSNRFDKSAVEFWRAYDNPLIKLVYGSKDAVLSNKRLAFGALGKIPKSVDSVLKTVLDVDFNVNFIRLGTGFIGPSALVSTLLMHTNKFGEYFQNSKNKEIAVDYIRKLIFSGTNPAIVKQQLWYLTDEEILDELKMMEEPVTSIDTCKWIAAFEEAFDINIYVFVNETYEVPDCKDFYIKPKRYDRKSLVLWKYPADSEVEHIAYDIINIKEDSKRRTLDAIPGLSIKLHRIYEIYSQTFIFKKYNNVWMKESSCIFDIPNILEQTSMILLGVSFDEFGKVRYHHVEYKGINFTIVIPPNSHVRQDTKDLKSIRYEQPARVIRETFGDNGVENSNIIWYDIGDWYLELGVLAAKNYIPIQDEISETEKSNSTKLLIEVAEYLWLSTENNFTVNAFMNQCFEPDDTEKRLPSVTSRYLPEFKTFNETFEYIKTILTPFNQGIVISNTVFESLSIYLKRKIKSSYIVKKKFLTKNYDLVEMFSQYSNMKVFLSRTDFELWNSSSGRNPLILFNTKLLPSQYTYTYYSENGSFYYIHNAIDFIDAIWKSFSLHFPESAKRIDKSDAGSIPVMLFRAINETYLQRVKTKQVFERKPRIFAQVVIYQNGEYGALEEVYRP